MLQEIKRVPSKNYTLLHDLVMDIFKIVCTTFYPNIESYQRP